MIWVSDLGELDLGRDSGDHYNLAASMMSLLMVTEDMTVL